jgi:hypothetical protein
VDGRHLHLGVRNPLRAIALMTAHCDITPPSTGSLTGRRLRKQLRIGCTVVVLVWLWYFQLQPWWYLEGLAWANDSDDSAQRSECVEALVDMGPRAVPQIIGRIGRGSIWSKSTRLLPIVLSDIGNPGHQALLQAIDREPDPWRQVHYAAALLDAYDDFSRVHLWIEALRNHPRLMPRPLWWKFFERFGEGVPPIQKDGSGELNPAFLEWYRKHTIPEGPLPPLKPPTDPGSNSSHSRPPVDGKASSQSLTPAGATAGKPWAAPP